VRVEGTEAILERLERHELRKLPTENLGVSAKVMGQDVRGLLVLREVSALEESARAGGVHEEVRRSVQLNDETTRARRRASGGWNGFTRLQLYALDEGERKFDLVASRIVVDIIGDTCLIRRIEDDEVHGILTDSAPGSDAQGATSEVMNNCGWSVNVFDG
jgi:hypothetical protein